MNEPMLKRVDRDTWLDVSNEAERTYDFGNGKTFTVKEPLKLMVRASLNGDSHRIIASDGEGGKENHYVPSGWVGITWVGFKKEETYEF